jgi:hypothetical protein
MSKVVIVLEIERNTLGRALSFFCESFQHSLFQTHHWIIFTKPSIDYSACSALFIVLFQQRLLALGSNSKSRPPGICYHNLDIPVQLQPACFWQVFL